MSNTEISGKIILLVNDGSIRKKFILERLQELSVKVICLNRTKSDFAVPFVQDWILADLNDESDCLEKVREYCKKFDRMPFDGVVTFWDENIILTASLAEAFGLVGIPVNIASAIKNKNDFRAACLQAGIPAPHQKLLRNKEEIDNLPANLKFPLIIKPVYGASSAFVMKTENIDELKFAFEIIQDHVRSFYLASEWKNLDILVEEYVDGPEVDIDILIQDGIIKYFSIIDNKETNEPFFVETGRSCPSSLNLSVQEQLINLATDTLNKLGVANGCIHFEAKNSSRGPIPVEVNLRMGGGEVYLYSKKIWGVDLVEGAVKIALGVDLQVQKPSQPLTCLASHRFLPENSCIIKDQKISAELKSKPQHVNFYWEKNVGDKFMAPPQGYDRSVGVLTISGNDLKQTKENLSEALKYISYTVESI
ncbi:MAG: ATP-grasp domain-containing protein [Candidatus Magasanikbacteria bacterium]|nr:ATP-grasp domain-containing protein [Candidatus Magasanikbacteria bacterium]